MANVTLLDKASANQTSDWADSFSRGAMFAQAVVSGGTLTAGTLVSESSLDGVHSYASSPIFSFVYGDIAAGKIISATQGIPFTRFVIANLAFNYGKTQTTGSGLDDLTIAGTYTPLKASTYKIKISDADVDVTAASALATISAKPADGSVVTLGAQPYTFRDALTGASAVAATTTLTSTGVAPTDGNTVTLGSQAYTFKTTLSAGPAVAFEVLIGISAATALDNLKSAVNASAGSGTAYGTGTTGNVDLSATTNTDTTQLFVATVAGAAGNALASTRVGATLSFPAVTWATPGTGADIVATVAFEVLAGASAAVSLDNLALAVNNGVANNGAGAGTTFGTSTTANATISATTNTDTTQLFVAKTPGAAGNALASTTTGASVHITFPAVLFTGGLAAVNDLFEWSKDGGAYSAPIAITGSAQTVVDGITVQFGSNDEHTPGDEWTVTPAAISVYMSK